MTYVPRAGAQLASLALTNEAFDPEEFENIEVGAKWDLNPGARADGRAVPARPQERRHSRIRQPIPRRRSWSTGSAPRASRSASAAQVSESWSIQGGYAYQDGHLTDGWAARRLAQLPKHVASLWNRYDFSPAFGVGLGVIYQTEMFAAADNAVELPGFTRVDAGVYYTPNERLRMQLNVENLLRRALLPERAQQQQHHAGLAAGRPGLGDRELLTPPPCARPGSRTTLPGRGDAEFGAMRATVRAAVRVRGRVAVRLRLVAAHRLFDRHAAAGAGECRARRSHRRSGALSRDLLRRARSARPRTARLPVLR